MKLENWYIWNRNKKKDLRKDLKKLHCLTFENENKE